MRKTYFSIVIPTYNNVKGLRDTLCRLEGIKYEDYEVIVVNDGSSDATGDFLATYRNGHIKSINIKNSGVSVARNVGMAEARGDYVVFMDDDDECNLDILEILDSKIKKYGMPEIIRFGGDREDRGGEKDPIRNPFGFDVMKKVDEGFLEDILLNPKKRIECYVWLIAIRNQGIRQFRSELRYLEDDLFLMDNLSRNNQTILFVPECLYTYKYNSNSKTKSMNNVQRNINDLLMSRSKMIDIFRSKKHKKMINANIFLIIFSCYWRIRTNLSNNDRKKLAKDIGTSLVTERIRINRYFSIRLTVKYLLMALEAHKV